MDRHQQDINKKLSGLKAPIHRDKLWQSIENHEDFPKPEKAKKKKRFWIFLLLPFLALLFVSIPFIYQNVFEENTIGHESQRELNLTTTGLNESIVIDEAVEVDHSVSASDSKSPLTESNTASEPKTTSTASVQHSSQPQESIVLNEKVLNQNPKHKTEFKESRSTYTSFVQEEMPENSQTNANAIGQIHNNKSESENGVKETVVETRGLFVDFKMLQNAVLFLPQLQRNIDPMAYPLTEVFEKDVKNKRWSVTMAMGMGYEDTSISKISSDVKSIYGLRKHNTRSLESYTLSGAVSYNFKSNWRISAGLQHQNTYQEYIYIDSETEYIPSQNDNHFFSELRTSTEHHFFHRFRNLDATFAIGQFFVKSKWELSYDIGVAINTIFDVKGSLLDENAQSFDINFDNAYGGRLNTRILGGLSLARKFGSKGDLVLNLQLESPKYFSDVRLYRHRTLPSYIKLGYRFSF